MNKSIHSTRNDFLRGRLIELRKIAGLTQRQLAAKLKTGQALIARIELGERRVDLVELHSILEALDVDPVEEIRRIVSGFNEGSWISASKSLVAEFLKFRPSGWLMP